MLHYIKYSESSVIVYCYTRLHGRVSLIVQGVRKKKARIRLNHLQPLQINEIDFNLKEKQGLTHLKELKPLHHADNIPADHFKSAVALFVAEMLYKTLKEEVKNEALFDFLESNIETLNNTNENLPAFYLHFLTDYMAYLGFHPNTDAMENASFFDLKNGFFTTIKPNHEFYMEGRQLDYLKKLIENNEGSFIFFTIPVGERNRLLDSLLDYYMLHVDGFSGLKSTAVLREVFRG